MDNFTPPDVVLPEHLDEPDRVGRLLGSGVSRQNPARAVILGYPGDEGLRRCGARVGTSAAPAAIRRELYRLTSDGRDPRLAELLGRTQDLGDLPLSGDVEQDQNLLGAALARLFKADVITILLGGGQDASYGHFLGHVNARQNVSILSWDAQADVLPLRDGLAHRGSAFRQALTHSSQSCRMLTVAALQPHRTPSAHLDFVNSRGGRYYWRRGLDRPQIEELYGGGEDRLMVSFDLGAVEQSQAPGVDPPCAGGLDASLWLHAAHQAGRARHVASIDVVECNPHLDPAGHTARLGALTVWRFLSGLAERY
ncbi:MAG TPA: formimidoylglutamase [Acidobacteriota bacterium]|nr:formimidoylglutamase [Acidobacteriota bacterium]